MDEWVQCNVKVGKMIKNPVNQRKLHMVHTLRFGKSTKVAHGRTRVKMSDPWSARQQRQLSFISEFTTDIQHISGKDNVVADCLSRASINNITLGIDYA